MLPAIVNGLIPHPEPPLLDGAAQGSDQTLLVPQAAGDLLVEPDDAPVGLGQGQGVFQLLQHLFGGAARLISTAQVRHAEIRPADQIPQDPGLLKSAAHGLQIPVGLLLGGPGQHQGKGGIPRPEGPALGRETLQILGRLIQHGVAHGVAVLEIDVRQGQQRHHDHLDGLTTRDPQG